MDGPLTFHMGRYPAVLPADRRYCRNHMWCLPGAESHRFGFTAYAIRLMQDVYFLDWHISPGDALTRSREIGHIETSKATSDLFAPVAGTLAELNAELLQDPTPINVDPYGAGWLFAMRAELGETMTVAEYHQYLDANWERTQQTLKGRI